ncbi:MAG: flagellar basal body-associated protein FliL [Thermodesulfobacteriota bacterium]
MSDEKEESKEEGKETKKKKSKLILIIIPLAVILLGGGGFFAYKTFLASPDTGDEQATSEDGGHGKHGEKKHGKKKHAKKSEHGGHGEEAAGEGPAFFNLAPFVVNLQDNIGTRYLKLTVKLELADSEVETELKGQLPKVRDALIILLSSKNYSEIGTVEGKYRLRDEIVKRINRLLRETSVKGAYFTDFVIQ